MTCYRFDSCHWLKLQHSDQGEYFNPKEKMTSLFTLNLQNMFASCNHLVISRSKCNSPLRRGICGSFFLSFSCFHVVMKKLWNNKFKRVKRFSFEWKLWCWQLERERTRAKEKRNQKFCTFTDRIFCQIWHLSNKVPRFRALQAL